MILKHTISKPMYDLLKFYSDICYEQKDEATYLGVKLLDEPEKFVKGQLFNAVAMLVVYNKDKDEKEYDLSVRKLHSVIDLIRKDKVNTWGKITLLRGVCCLYKANLLNLLSDEEIEVLKEKSRYDDFLTIETMDLHGYPSNYYQVAMAIAGMREMLCFDKGNTSEKIKEKLFSVMNSFSDTGWMDDNPPHGRFDRYSFVISSELADTLLSINKEVPDYTKENLKQAYKLALACANPHGDGVIYGRSLSIHGDCAYLEIMSSALRLGIVEKEDIDTVLSYSCCILKKALSFWFDKERNSFNLWFDGRTTNNYRQVRRLLEVNFDMALHMLNTLNNIDKAGYAEIDIDENLPKSPFDFGNPYTVVFIDDNNKKRILFNFVHNEKLIQLPLIGVGTVRRAASYLPFPAIVGELEASPEAQVPWLVPEFQDKNGKVYVPYEFYTDIQAYNKDNATTIVAKGNLSAFDDKNLPIQTDYAFTNTYVFEGNTITMKFKTDLDSKAKVLFPKRENSNVVVSCNGEHTKTNIEDNPMYFTPHGRCTILNTWLVENNEVILKVTL